jgi:hypothetical protein
MKIQFIDSDNIVYDSEVEKNEELTAHIAVNGILNPIIVSQLADGNYLVTNGNHRMRSCVALGIERIPCVVVEQEEQILFVLIGSDQKERTYALVPRSKLGTTDYIGINGLIVNEDEVQDPYKCTIVMNLFNRFGFDKQPGIKTDLKKYLLPKCPMLVDQVIIIGWLV